MDSISKPQFQARVENTGIEADATYYSFSVQGIHCVVLDANYNPDGSDYDHGKENNSYAILEVYDESRIVVTRYRKAVSTTLEKS